MSKEVKVDYVSEESRFSGDFKPPASFFIVDALGQGVYIHTRSRSKAQEVVDELYGAGKYKIRVEVKASVR